MRSKISALGVKKYVISLAALTLFLFGTIVSAQEADDVILSGDEAIKAISESEWGKPIEEITQGADCFNYYAFPSVQVSLGSESDQYYPGDSIKFFGEITNENNYPVVDGNVFVRVSRNNNNFLEEGHFVIDEFIAIEDVTIDKDSQIEESFEWKVPEGLPSGSYVVDYFFSAGKKFNLGGLPFSNEIVIGKSFFNIEGYDDSFISFDKSGTQVNEEKYRHIGNWPVIAPGERALITQPIVNTFDEEKEIDIKYDLYYWDSLNEDDLIRTESRKVTVSANESTNLEYEIREVNEPVYYLRMTATSGDQKSIVNIRIASEQEKPRLNYPAITKFPVYKGDNFTLFSCFHNTSGINTEGKVLVTLKDKKGKEVGRMEYSGKIPSAMSADKIDIIAENDYEYLKLEAEVYDKDGKVVDKYEVVYDCEKIGNCKVEMPSERVDSRNIFSVKNILIMIFVVIIIATVVVVIIEKKKK